MRDYGREYRRGGWRGRGGGYDREYGGGWGMGRLASQITHGGPFGYDRGYDPPLRGDQWRGGRRFTGMESNPRRGVYDGGHRPSRWVDERGHGGFRGAGWNRGGGMNLGRGYDRYY